MKMQIDKVLTPQAAGAPQMTVAIVPQHRGPRDVVPAQIALMAVGGGETVRIMLSTEEARMFGEMLITCGCVAEGGHPPVVQAEPEPQPLIIGGR